MNSRPFDRCPDPPAPETGLGFSPKSGPEKAEWSFGKITIIFVIFTENAFGTISFVLIRLDFLHKEVL